MSVRFLYIIIITQVVIDGIFGFYMINDALWAAKLTEILIRAGMG